MKGRFHGYYRPTDEEFEALWKDAIIVLDANVLLNQYSYSHETREEFLRLLSEMGERVWLPIRRQMNFIRIAAKSSSKRQGVIERLLALYSLPLGTYRQQSIIHLLILACLRNSKLYL
jgi:predicted nucleic acid-binding protein